MKSNLVAEYIFIGGILFFYFIYTIMYAFTLKKNPFFRGRRKIFHMIMIWLVPFLWIMFLKDFFKPIPGSYHFKNKKDRDPFTEKHEGDGWTQSGLDTHDDGGHHQ